MNRKEYKRKKVSFDKAVEQLPDNDIFLIDADGNVIDTHGDLIVDHTKLDDLKELLDEWLNMSYHCSTCGQKIQLSRENSEDLEAVLQRTAHVLREVHHAIKDIEKDLQDIRDDIDHAECLTSELIEEETNE